jgi:ribosomal silencing factor RsfS
LGSDISLLDMGGVCGFVDYFVIVSGESARQLDAMLLDYGDIIVHIFSSAERAYYKFDDLWNLAKPVVRMA